MQSIHVEPLISHYIPPFQIATARDSFFCLEILGTSTEEAVQPVTSISHLPSGVEEQMPHFRCGTSAVSLKGKSVWWCDKGTGEHSVELAAFMQHAEDISEHFGEKVNSNNSWFWCSQFTLEVDEWSFLEVFTEAVKPNLSRNHMLSDIVCISKQHFLEKKTKCNFKILLTNV